MNTEITGFKKITKKYFKPFGLMLIFILVLCLVSSVLNTLPSLYIGEVVQSFKKSYDEAVLLGADNAIINTTEITRLLVMLGLCYLTNNVFFYLANFLAGKVVQTGVFGLRTDINSKINRLPVSYFDRRLQGTVLSTVTNDVDSFCTGFQQSVVRVVCAIFDIVVTFFLLIRLSPKNGTLMLLIIPVIILTTRMILKYSRSHFLKMQNYLADLNGYAQEHFNGFTVNKLNNREDTSQEGFEKISNKITHHSIRGAFTSSVIAPTIDLITYIAYIVMIVFITNQVFDPINPMPVATMFAFLHLVWLIYAPFGQITQVLAPMQSAMASLKRIADFLEEKEERPDADTEFAKTYVPEKVVGNVEFRHVAFRYDKNKPLISDLSFTAKAGQKIAIVGPTGAGKTTLINLLMRFYDPSSGQILIDGVDGRDISRADLRSLFGMVLQDTWLYHETIRENIRFGNLDATDDEIVAAAKTAGVDHFIRTLPDGYDMVLDEESSNISAGQKQLLTIARVIIKDPTILILDEATSSIDTRLERLIQEAMDRVMQGKTSFVIAHRLSTIINADLILVMQHGDIVESGTHEALLAQGGLYSTLYLSQFSEEAE